MPHHPRLSLLTGLRLTAPAFDFYQQLFTSREADSTIECVSRTVEQGQYDLFPPRMAHARFVNQGALPLFRRR
jgi:hypothetical protein